MGWQRFKAFKPIERPEGSAVVFANSNATWIAPDTLDEAFAYSGYGPEYYLVLPPLPREPRRMSVQAWEQFTKVVFRVGGFKYYWTNRMLFNYETGIEVSLSLGLLEAEGVEVVE